MEFKEVLRLGGPSWDSYREEFLDCRPQDWVLLVAAAYPLRYRILAVFDEDYLEVGQTVGEAVEAWSEEAGDSLDYTTVEEMEALLKAEEGEDEDASPEEDEDAEAQWWEDERWRDDL